MLEISLTAIKNNYSKLKSLLNDGATCGASVKANAYGLGVAEVATALYARGCREFFVSSAEEGRKLKEILTKLLAKTLPKPKVSAKSDPKSKPIIYVLHGVNSHSEVKTVLEAEITPVINNNHQLQLWQVYGNPDLPIALHLDTGLNRLGWPFEEIAKIPMNLSYCLVMSHLACADEPNHRLNQLQLERFRYVVEYFIRNYNAHNSRQQKHKPFPKFSLANSSGIFLGPEYHFDLVRPGYALYGGMTLDKTSTDITPTLTAKRKMNPVLKLRARIIQKNTVLPSQSIGYGATYATNSNQIKTFVIETGYGDGYTRFGTEGAVAWIADHLLPVVGRISMDLTVVDATSLPESLYNTIEYVELLNEHITIDDVRKINNNMIGYEFITRLGSRYQRIYT